MTATRTGEQLSNQTGRVNDPLLSCLSRLILEPDWIEPRHAANTCNRGAIDSASISRAIVRETLLFSEVASNLTAALQVPTQVHAQTHR